MKHPSVFRDRQRQELDIGVTHTSMGKMFFNRWCWADQMTTQSKIKLDYYLLPHGKVDCNQNKGQNLNGKTIIEEKVNGHDSEASKYTLKLQKYQP